MLTETEIANAIDAAITTSIPLLHVPAGINPTAILKSIAGMETAYGKRYAASLHEKAYCYGGRYFNATLKDLSWVWGCNAHSSHGVWQILYITAYEKGFRDDPIRLREPKVCAEYVVKVLNARVFDKLTDEKPEDVFDAWNSGNPRDDIVPQEYIDKAMTFYRRLV